ncbi:uncharacterized protein LOC108021985 [Drosophila biarmipes]|uniref:uncharacterized protein LOC108021985 n=1 Tax=Drosophila biarmipes TaxID=125945 RepID=UPI0021CC65E1|nr:uncharacterized protein LOC108021985 [Drosophila biarmipes]
MDGMVTRKTVDRKFLRRIVCFWTDHWINMDGYGAFAMITGCIYGGVSLKTPEHRKRLQTTAIRISAQLKPSNEATKMLKQSLILILILWITVCCFSAELPGNAYLPPLRIKHTVPDESLPEGNGFLFDIDQDSFERYAPIFVDYPGIHHLLRQQQEYALDLPFEGKPYERKIPEVDNDFVAKRNW